MWLIVGLGNPGRRYARTRHNIGFLVLGEFLNKHGLEFTRKRGYRICSGSIEGTEIVLIEPLTFMNRSGAAARKIMDWFKIPPEKIIVIHDDIDMEVGRLKIRRRGSSGGHRGVESVIQNIGLSNFIRIKIGIGRDEFISTEDYVLTKFRRKELPLIMEALKKAGESIHSIITEGIDKAMNRFNQ